MSKFGNEFHIVTPPLRPLPKTEILWGNQEGGGNSFPPGMAAITSRMYSDNPEPLESFGRAVASAHERVWVIDEFFLIPDGKAKITSRIEKILAWLHIDLVASDVRILTKSHKEIDEDVLDLFRRREQEINEKPARRPKKCMIEVRSHLTQRFDCVHDRFAIIDDELWHFGGTVGGFHSKVSAASRGWRASDHGAIEFFEMAWNAGGRP